MIPRRQVDYVRYTHLGGVLCYDSSTSEESMKDQRPVVFVELELTRGRFLLSSQAVKVSELVLKQAFASQYGSWT